MLYSKKEERKRAQWKKHWFEQKLMFHSTDKLRELSKGAVRKRMRKAH